MTLGELARDLKETVKVNKKLSLAVIAGVGIGINTLSADNPDMVYENIQVLEANCSQEQMINYKIQSETAYLPEQRTKAQQKIDSCNTLKSKNKL